VQKHHTTGSRTIAQPRPLGAGQRSTPSSGRTAAAAMLTGLRPMAQALATAQHSLQGGKAGIHLLLLVAARQLPGSG
jgi:hypothetical protein